jgi:hypothetical protein
LAFANEMSGIEQIFYLKKHQPIPRFSRYTRMRATFDDAGSGSGAQPRNPARYRLLRRAWWGVIFVMAFGWGMAIAAAYDAVCGQQTRGVMDQPW